MNSIVSAFFFFKQKTAYEMRISDWSSDVCSSDLEALARQPKVEGAGAGQLYLAQETNDLFGQAEKLSEEAGDSYVTAERILLAMAMLPGTAAAKALAAAGGSPQSLNQAINAMRKGRRADTATAEDQYEALNKYARDLTEVAREGKLDPVIDRKSTRLNSSP